jgi:hypothetical protein
MMRVLLALVLCLALVPATNAQQKPGDPIRLTVSPAKPPVRPLQYRFAFEEVAKRAGNAATEYKEAGRLYRAARGSEGAEFETQQDAWLQGDLKDLPIKEIDAFFETNKEILPLLEKAARCDRCDWGHREAILKQGIALLIPEVQDMRYLIRMVAVHCRLVLAKGQIGESLHDVRLGLVMARHTADSPIFISMLAGVAMSNIMFDRLDEIIQAAGAPSLYAALTELPSPFISLRPAIEGERLALYGTFPGIADCVQDLNAGPMTQEQIQACTKVINGLFEPSVKRYLEGLNILVKHEAAKKALIAAGRPKEKVDAMPHLQVALLHALLQLDGKYDEMLMMQSLPPWEVANRKEQPRPALGGFAGGADDPAIPLAPLFLPSIQRVTRAQLRLDRRIAALRCVEAIRLYAAAHDGKLPPSLASMKDKSLPVDPFTGTPFEYSVSDKTALLKGNVSPEEKNSPPERLTYEITIRQ